jgi:hypothetical protein
MRKLSEPPMIRSYKIELQQKSMPTISAQVKKPLAQAPCGANKQGGKFLDIIF